MGEQLSGFAADMCSSTGLSGHASLGTKSGAEGPLTCAAADSAYSTHANTCLLM